MKHQCRTAQNLQFTVSQPEGTFLRHIMFFLHPFIQYTCLLLQTYRPDHQKIPRTRNLQQDIHNLIKLMTDTGNFFPAFFCKIFCKKSICTQWMIRRPNISIYSHNLSFLGKPGYAAVYNGDHLTAYVIQIHEKASSSLRIL